MNYVDLGLSVKWADCNNGSENPYENGEYYCFDDIKDYPNVPTIEQWKELQKECSFKYDKEKNGVIVTGKNGNEIFFPFAGEKNGQIEDRTIGAFFWSNSEYYDDRFAWNSFVSKKVYAKKLRIGNGFISRDKFYISVRTIETYDEQQVKD